MEKVRFNETQYDLVANGLQLTDQGGKVIFRPGASTFAAIEEDARTAKSITVLDDAGEPVLTRTDLVYAGRIAKDDNYIVGAENIEDGAVETRDVTGDVMIVEFRTPDLSDKVAELEANLEYVTMMAGIEMEV